MSHSVSHLSSVCLPACRAIPLKSTVCTQMIRQKKYTNLLSRVKNEPIIFVGEFNDPVVENLHTRKAKAIKLCMHLLQELLIYKKGLLFKLNSTRHTHAVFSTGKNSLARILNGSLALSSKPS